ncbi:MAG: YebC/PmpR family DNA-binding transcriptional regulator [Pirellulales bacterium]
MAGHSHWAGIKHKKALIDTRRGKLWSKLAKAIIVAAKGGGGDPDANLRLRYAISDAKAVSMPKENIERAIKRGTGELEGGNLESVMYEGHGPAGVAVLCEILTDNRNRTAPEIRKLFEINGGKLGATGCAAWMFDRKGLLIVSTQTIDEDSLMELALEAGAEDVRVQGDVYEVISELEAYNSVCEAIDSANLATESREITWIAKDTVEVTGGDARRVLRLVELLDEHDDVQSVAANFNVPDEAMAEIEAG